MRAKIWCLIFIGLVVILITAGLIIPYFTPRTNRPTYGVWWWSDSLGDEYLDFAASQQITEIYYCSGKFNQDTNQFLQAAHARNIQVDWLAGEYQWIENPAALYRQIDRFQTYQQTYPHRFRGIHLDIEPHQHPNFKSQRAQLITGLVDLAYAVHERYPDLIIGYDLPFWLEDEITTHGATKPAFQHMMDVADRVTLMSYRDTAAKIYAVAEAEIDYAQKIHKPLNLGVETKSDEGNQVSFQEEGKNYMNTVLQQLRTMIPADFGIIVHQIKTWYQLPD